MNLALHSMNAVVRATGLSAHVIRVWERRYGAVKPERTESNRRLYSADQVERLKLLQRLVETGQSIRYIAKLPTDQLRVLAGSATTPQAPPSSSKSPADSHQFVGACLTAIYDFDGAGLAQILQRADVQLGSQGLLQHVIAPLAQQIGTQWREGNITAAQEHLATAVLRSHLGRSVHVFSGGATGPMLVVATPAGQLHELGALLVCAFAAKLGWQTTYLGASLPAAEIAGAAHKSQARAVALSIVYPDDDPQVAAEIVRLRDMLPPEIALFVGGRAAASYRQPLDNAGVLLVGDLAQLGSTLDQLRGPANRSPS
jgi:DNA-binding transcriptional MerR regulator/methylmalonyl-CoA mutase cobalamin-binding subunit